MKRVLFLIYIILINIYCYSQENEIDLKNNANAVIENDNTVLIITSDVKAILKKEITVTILNKNGDKFAIFSQYYDSFRKIKKFEGKVFNSNGTLLTKLKLNDLEDNSLISSFSLYEDNRIKYYRPQIKKYPYKVKYTYEIEYKGTLYLPKWQPINASYISVKYATYKVIAPSEGFLRFKLLNIGNPEKTILDNEISYLWAISDIEARELEPLRASYQKSSPAILVAPNQFKHGDYTGNMQSWKSFGFWRYNLIKNKTALPQDAIEKVKEIVKNSTTKINTIKNLYQYVQSQTRYVSIQEGIGGWQPFDATTVHNLGYGDCKALTNYTKALLEAAGIKSHYSVIKAGRNVEDIITDFPSNQFNHVILCVPIEKDTIWLECTSQNAPMGYLGRFTEDRHALLITENGGVLAKTPKYSKEINTQKRTIHADLLENGSVKLQISTHYNGLQYENISHLIESCKEDRKEYLYLNLDFNSFIINDFSYSFIKDVIPSAVDSISITVNKYANVSSSRIFVPLNMLNKSTYIPKKLDERVSPIQFTFPYCDSDSIEITYPKKYEIEFMPKDIFITSQFGEFSMKVKSIENRIYFVRKKSINKGVYPKESYEKLREFFIQISKVDNSKCVLKLKSKS
jgi:transglutaminase-like putative cysteine protease